MSRYHNQEPQVWTDWHIHTNGKGGVLRVDYSTNDDNDDGVPDTEVVNASYHPKTLKTALDLTGVTRVGVFGHRVSVWLDGKILKEFPMLNHESEVR